MAKAMLIVNEPKCCGKCDLAIKTKSKSLVRCVPLKKLVDRYANAIQNVCPLLVPIKEKETLLNDEFDEGYVQGYNACIDEILGGGE